MIPPNAPAPTISVSMNPPHDPWSKNISTFDVFTRERPGAHCDFLGTEAAHRQSLVDPQDRKLHDSASQSLIERLLRVQARAERMNTPPLAFSSLTAIPNAAEISGRSLSFGIGSPQRDGPTVRDWILSPISQSFGPAPLSYLRQARNQNSVSSRHSLLSLPNGLAKASESTGSSARRPKPPAVPLVQREDP
jgi:hypothetical protein